MILRPRQIAAVEAVRTAYRRGKRRVLLVGPTGFGKTECYLSVVHGALARGNKVLVLASQEELIEQPGRKLDAAGQDFGVIQADHPRRRPWLSLQLASVQTLARRGTRPEAAVIICDEAHLFVADTFKKIVQDYPHAVILGLTATPRRLDGRGLGELFDELIIATTIEQEVADGFLVPVRTIAPIVPDFSELEIARGDFARGKTARFMEQRAIIGNIVESWQKWAADGYDGRPRPTIAFGVDIAHSKKMTEAFRAAGVNAAHVDGNAARAERSRLLAALAAGEIDMLWNAQLLTLGIDVPRVSCLDAKTEVLTPAGWKGVNDVISEVIAFDQDGGALSVTDVEARTEGQRQEMVSLKSGAFDVRVTPDHRMLIGTGRRHRPFRWLTATELPTLERFRLPVSGKPVNKTGLEVTDEELRFIAWFITDGGWTRTGHPGHGIRIAQSKPEFVKRIRSLLIVSGFTFHEYTRSNQRGFGGPNALPLHVFVIPLGTRGKTKGKGFAHFLHLLDKDLSVSLFTMSPRQFEIFWNECLLGDGSNSKRPGRQQQLCGSSLLLLSRLQALAIRCGFATNASMRTLPSGKPFWWMSVSKRRMLEIKPNDKRRPFPSVFHEDVQPERVWCLQNRLGTLVIRREGSVSIVGNCVVMARPTLSETVYLQEGGRGLRPYDGKENLLLLDHAGNCLRHGLIEWPRTWSLHGIVRKSKGERVPGLRLPCEKCGSVCPSTCLVCTLCGHIFPKKPRIVITRPGELQEVGSTLSQRAGVFNPEMRAEKLAKWMRDGIEHGYSSYRALVIFKKVFGLPADYGIQARAKAIMIERYERRAHG